MYMEGKNMSIYIIGDLHLALSTDKPMDIFGSNWKNHAEKIKKDWISKVKKEDLVILPGDFCWSTYLEETYKEFDYLKSLPGKKLLLKGNHDYWWTTLNKMRNFLKKNNYENIDFIYNNAYVFEEYIITGTRGWGTVQNSEDEKILNRELARLELSLSEANKINKGLENKKEIITFIHYPPITNINNVDENKFLKLMNKYNVKRCFFAHLHGASINDKIEGNVNNIELKLVSADGLDFKLLKLEEN